MAGILPTINVFADYEYEGECGEGINYSFDKTTGELTISGNGRMKDYIDYNESPWCNYRDKIKSVVIGKDVTHIGNFAFVFCEGLKSATISGDVRTIGTVAFAICTNLTSIEIPNSVTTVGLGAFTNCRGLTSVTISDSVTTIGKDAFSVCINLASVIYLGTKDLNIDSIFSYCKELKTINVPANYEGNSFCGIEVEKNLAAQN